MIIPYNLAIKLQQLKFDTSYRIGNITSLYDKNGNHVNYSNYGMMYSGLNEGYINAPSFDIVFDWFRRKKKLHGYVYRSWDTWCYAIQDIKGIKNAIFCHGNKSFDEAQEKLLTHLINLKK